MNEQEYRAQLEREGFSNIYVREDGAGKHYAPHTHEKIAAHIILEGQMSVTMFGHPALLGQGKRMDIPAGVVHEATMGANGCKYLVGEK